MTRMGKRQEFSVGTSITRPILEWGLTKNRYQRNFGFMSIVGYSIVAMLTWEGQLVQYLPNLTGALSNILWLYLAIFLLWCTVVASMAEMASIAPTSGGQYHWVSEFAPRRFSRILSYVTGWSCILGWQLNFVSVASNIAQDIQSLLVLTGSTFVFQAWQQSFVLMATAAIAVMFNTNISNSLPLIGGAFVLLYICTYLAFLVTLWVLAPRTDAAAVFTSFSNRGDTGGIARTLVFTLMSPDVAIHMAEEIRDASLVLPRAIMTSTVINGTLGLLMLITYCFTIGDISAVISSGVVGHIQILHNATHSTGITLALTIAWDILGIACCITSLTSASRQLFAFARDKGIPFASVIAYVRPGWNVPFNAILVSFGFCLLISVLNVISARALATIVSVTVSSNICSYLISISCIRIKRWNETLPARRWSLGRCGGPINDVAILFLAFLFILFFVPGAHQVTAKNMNWNIVVWGGIVSLSLCFYYIQGRKVYTSPVILIQTVG